MNRNSPAGNDVPEQTEKENQQENLLHQQTIKIQIRHGQRPYS